MSLKTAVAGTLVLLAATVVAYVPAFYAGFIWDDDDYVTDNQTLRTADGLYRIWFKPGAVPQYYPLVHTTYWIEYRLWGLNAAGYHAVNVVLHAVNALLLWLVLRQLELPGAWIAAALFALHPVHVESVVWVTERKNTLSGLFYLLALLAYLRFRPLSAVQPGHPRRAALFYILALLAFLAALASKTVTCSLPAAVLLLTWWKRGRVTLRDVAPLVPFFAAGLAMGLFTVHMEATRVGARGPEWELSFVQRLLIAGRALWFYAGKLVWPANLAFIYERWEVDVRVGWQYLFPAGALAAVGALWLGRRRLGRGPLVAVLFFAGTLAPALGFVNVYPMRYSFVADHFQYLASLGVIALAAGAAASVAQRLGPRARRAALAVPAVVLLVFGVKVWRQSLIYDDLETLWRDTLAKSPTAYIASNNLGVELGRQGRGLEAIPHLELAVRQRPDDAQCRTNLANAYADVGRLDEALQVYAVALELDPRNALTHFNLGTTYAQTGRLEEAISHLTQAVRLDRRKPEARTNLAQAVIQRAGMLLADGRAHEAVPLLTEAARDAPGSLPVRFLLAQALGETGRTRAAIAQYRDYLAAQPDDLLALNALAWYLATDPDPAVRRGAEAVQLAERADRLARHQDPGVLDTLAAALAEVGDFEQAVTVARQARELAERLGIADLVAELEERIRLYSSHTPYHTPASAAGGHVPAASGQPETLRRP